jgi:hypothetical protein
LFVDISVVLSLIDVQKLFKIYVSLWIILSNYGKLTFKSVYFHGFSKILVYTKKKMYYVGNY